MIGFGSDKNSYQETWRRTDLTSKINNNAFNPIKICEEEPTLHQKFTIKGLSLAFCIQSAPWAKTAVCLLNKTFQPNRRQKSK